MKNKTALIFAVVYLVIAGWAIWYTQNSYNNTPAREFNGFLAILVTLPLSLLRFFFKHSSNGTFIAQSIVYALVNTLLIFFWINRSNNIGQVPPPPKQQQLQ